MTRFFTPLWEETASFSPDLYTVSQENKYFGRITITHSTKKESGVSYVTVLSKETPLARPDLKNKMSAEVRKALQRYFSQYHIGEQSKVLTVCLGNEKITCDSFAPRVGDKLLVTSHLYKQEAIRQKYGNLCVLKPNVAGNSGIESFHIVQGTIREIKPDILLAVDTLSCSSLTRLATCVQLSDGGIEPGGGVGNAQKALNQNSLKIPVIAIGVPLVIYVSRILAEYGATAPLKKGDPAAELIVSPRENDFICNDFADIVSSAINGAVHKNINSF